MPSVPGFVSVCGRAGEILGRELVRAHPPDQHPRTPHGNRRSRGNRRCLMSAQRTSLDPSFFSTSTARPKFTCSCWMGAASRHRERTVHRRRPGQPTDDRVADQVREGDPPALHPFEVAVDERAVELQESGGNGPHRGGRRDIEALLHAAGDDRRGAHERLALLVGFRRRRRRRRLRRRGLDGRRRGRLGFRRRNDGRGGRRGRSGSITALVAAAGTIVRRRTPATARSRTRGRRGTGDTAHRGATRWARTAFDRIRSRYLADAYRLPTHATRHGFVGSRSPGLIACPRRLVLTVALMGDVNGVVPPQQARSAARPRT